MEALSNENFHKNSYPKVKKINKFNFSILTTLPETYFSGQQLLKIQNQIKLRLSYTCVAIIVFRTSWLVNEIFPHLFHLT